MSRPETVKNQRHFSRLWIFRRSCPLAYLKMYRSSARYLPILRASVHLRAVDIVQPDQAEAPAAGRIDYGQDGDLRRPLFHEAEGVEQ